MGITLNLNTTKKTLEGKYEFTFKRERKDIKNTLLEIQNGNTIGKMFPTSVAISLKKQFQENGYIDSNGNLMAQGITFIKYPFKTDFERSIYTVEFMEVDIAGVKRQIVVNMTRRLVNEDNKPSTFTFQNLITMNEIQINDEKIYFERLENISKDKAYLGKEKPSKISFDVTSGTYNAGFGNKELGSSMNDLVNDYVKTLIKEKVSYFVLDDEMNVVVKNLSDFTMEDLLHGELSYLKTDEIEFSKVPLVITDSATAQKYAYLYMYNKIGSGEYLSFDEMNEAFNNEVLSSSIIDRSVKASMQGFTYSEEGFKKYLDKSKYDDLSYKLNVMKTLLNYESKDNKIHKVRNYFELTDYIKTIISPKDVNKVSLVLGYAMVNNSKNTIIECLGALKSEFTNIEIVAKNDGSNQKTSESIKASILYLGVPIKTNTEIGKKFHDRYIVFELKDGTYKVMLATNEIGQFFNVETHEPLGTLMVIPNEEVIKAGKSLINMVKEAR